MANPSDSFWETISTASTLQKTRMEQYSQQYGESHAYRLANAYMQYPWVNAELLVSFVLNDSDDMLPQLAEYAAARMAQSGVTPADIAYEEDIQRMMIEQQTAEYMKNDPSGQQMLNDWIRSGVAESE